MDFSWILLALFLVAVIRGITKSLSASMLKNLLRLGSVVVAFLITFALQVGGVFGGIVSELIKLVDIGSLIPGIGVAEGLISSLISTFVGPIVFIIVFLLILWVMRIVIFFVLRAVEKPKAKAAENEECTVQNSECTDKSAECADESAEKVITADAEAQPAVNEATEEPTSEPVAETTEESASEPVAEATEEPTSEPVAEATEEPAAEPAAEAPKAKKEKTKKAKKQKKPAIYPECAWKRIVSLAAGLVSGILMLAVLLMPVFYFGSIASAATDSIDGSDADDSMVYQIVEVVDEYFVEPYENSFVSGFYDILGISDLMNYTTKAGGKITLDNGNVAYADDTLKSILSHGLSAAIQLTSEKSECATVGEDINAIVSDPMISSIAADLLMEMLGELEMEPAEEEDLIGGLVENFVNYYKEADKTVIEKDLQAVSSTIGVLAKEKIILKLASGGEVDLESMLSDGETLGDVVEAISGLSAFGPTVEGAFQLGIEILGETLNIPANDFEAYEIFMDDLLSQMVKSSDTKLDLTTVQYYVYHTERLGVKATASNGVKGYSQFTAYVAQWEKVQSAFAHASEDKSYGYFTMVINGNTYIYDKGEKQILIYSESDPEIYEKYKDKVSPLAGLINALTIRSSDKQLSRDNLYAILSAYAASANDEVGVELANRILLNDGFTSKAVTVEKMLAATNFTNWTDEEKAADSRLCVDIITKLLGLMSSLGGDAEAEGEMSAIDMIDQFGVLGETMDTMKQTSCVNQLPALLIEGIVKNEIFAQYMKPSVAFQINNIVETNEGTYTYCMSQIGSVLKFAISAFGGITND